jgi:hypothetical protein
MSMERDQIGKTFVVKRADDLTLDDNVVVYRLTSGLYTTARVMSLELVGDDVEYYPFGFGEHTTSRGNAVMVEVEE